MALDTQIY